MIAVDTFAVLAIVLDEPEADACAAVLEGEDRVLISAGTVLEALIVARRRHVADELVQLVERLSFEIVSVTTASARRSAEAYSTWGKGVHPASLNFGDCFAYEVAKSYGCPLLYIGEAFARTDVASAL